MGWDGFPQPRQTKRMLRKKKIKLEQRVLTIHCRWVSNKSLEAAKSRNDSMHEAMITHQGYNEGG